jgi:hypothetical protein
VTIACDEDLFPITKRLHGFAGDRGPPGDASTPPRWAGASFRAFRLHAPY